jgi:allantoinase
LQRDFVGYANHPPAFRWPGGAGLALTIVINYEEGAEPNPLDGGEPVEPLGELGSFPARAGDRQVMIESQYEYGSRVGIWRLMATLDRHGVTPTIFACGQALERNMPATEAMTKRAYDMVGHGYRWISHFDMSEEEEREDIRRGVDSIERLTGQRPRGWFNRGPQTLATRRILAEEGLLFDCGASNDDIPYYQDVAGRPFLVIPYTLTANDWRFWQKSLFTARDFEAYLTDEFDVLLRESATAPKMMSVGLHSRITGRPGRISGLDRFLDHARSCEGVWLTTITRVAKTWEATFAPPSAWNSSSE